MDNKLALNGGPKTINHSFKKYNPIGEEELLAANQVIKSGFLSSFLASHGKDFLGGKKVNEFERSIEKYFDVKHAITVNSWTSGLIAAVGSLDINPGDEIIVPPWTMCATATAILHWNAIPVFADIEPETFNIDPDSIIKNITPRTKAIIAVDIFGHSADIDSLKGIAKKYNLKLISDTAQSPGALYNGKLAGTLSDIGGFSLNYHKHIHTGEGGIIVTNDSNLAERMQLIRNHAEAVVQEKGVKNLSNMIGYNFRLGEIECAMGIEQLKKLEYAINSRQDTARRLTDGLSKLSGIRVPIVKDKSTHVYYMYPMILDIEKLGYTRTEIFNALTTEGLQGLVEGYANIHLLPMFQQLKAYGSKGFPWTSEFVDRKIDYSKGICPVAEKLNEETFLSYEICLHDLTDDDIDLIVKAFSKVWSHITSKDLTKRK